MKKSRIIIPALSLIAFSVAASVTGAVAWFTASRSAQISAGTYSVVKTSAELKATLAPGVGTTIGGTNNDTVSFDGYLTDGSFNHKTKNIFFPDSSGKTISSSAPIALGSATAENLKRGTASDSKNIYTAATFDISFTISFGATEGDVGLYLDTNAGKSSFTVSDAAEAATAKGFRMAIVPKTIPGTSFGRATVFADLQDDSLCKYVADTSDTTLGGTAYVANDYDLIDKDYATALPEEGALEKANALKRADYLGFFKFSSGAQITLTYTVVAWFEGTDPEIVNRTAPELYQSVVSKLNFEAINLKD